MQSRTLVSFPCTLLLRSRQKCCLSHDDIHCTLVRSTVLSNKNLPLNHFYYSAYQTLWLLLDSVTVLPIPDSTATVNVPIGFCDYQILWPFGHCPIVVTKYIRWPYNRYICTVRLPLPSASAFSWFMNLLSHAESTFHFNSIRRALDTSDHRGLMLSLRPYLCSSTNEFVGDEYP